MAGAEPQSCGDAQAEEVLNEFLAERRAEAEAVLKADNALSEAEKQLEGEWRIPVLSLLSSPPHPSLCPLGTRGISQRSHVPGAMSPGDSSWLPHVLWESLQGHLMMAPSLEESPPPGTSHRVPTSLGVSQHALDAPQIVPFSSLRTPHPIPTSPHSVPAPLHPLPTSFCTVPSPHPRGPQGPHTPFFSQKQKAQLPGTPHPASLSADQKQQAQLLEQRQKAMAERERQLEALLEDERNSYAQNLQALEAKMQAEAESAQRELQRAMEAKLREQRELLQRGFREQAALMEQELAALRRESNNNSKQELAASILDAVRAACDLVSMVKVSKLAKSRGTAV